MDEDRSRTVRNLRLAALSVAATGGFFAFATGTWREGALGLAVSLAVALFGFGERLRGEDRAIGLVLILVGVAGILGHVAQLFLFV